MGRRGSAPPPGSAPSSGALPPLRLGIVLLPRSVYLLEERHGEGHAQELQKKTTKKKQEVTQIQVPPDVTSTRLGFSHTQK